MVSPQSTTRQIAVLISGGGTTLKNLIEKRKRGILAADIACVVSSRSDAKGLTFAHENEIPSHVVDWKRAPSWEAANLELFRILDQYNCDQVVAGGFLKRLRIPANYTNRVINIHPSLIPSFCGAGFYGLRVHQAVLDYGCKVSGCTVHFVDDEFDHGPLIAQATVPVLPNDTAEQLAARVFELECELYPHTINRLLGETYRIVGRHVLFES